MKTIKSAIIIVCIAAVSGCSFLDPLPDGHYTDENYTKYGSIVRGFIDKAYSLIETTYNTTEFIGLDGATDDAVNSSSTHAMRMFANNTIGPSSDPFSRFWSRDYEGINYANMFLEDNLGINTRYLIDNETNALLQKTLQGDAYALRAWFQYDLLKKFGGKSSDGQYLGFPIMLKQSSVDDIDAANLKRDTFEKCVEQIISDCNKALEYLPVANRDFLVEKSQYLNIHGAIRYKMFDQISVTALKAMTYLLWASPAFNPENDLTRWDLAAKNAAETMRLKLEIDGAVTGGFDPTKNFIWTDPNSPEAILPSNHSKNSSMESLFYPNGLKGNANTGPTQELVDAFPMANGYPISDPRSGYNPDNPYIGRDPRFYATIFYNGAEAKDLSNNVFYTFETDEGGKDQAGKIQTSLTNYYFKKYVYMGYNPTDDSPNTAPHSIFHIRWTSICLAYAEAANRASKNPNGTLYGFTPKQAIAYLRSRPTTDGALGIGTAGSDPYLDEMANAGWEEFEALVRNESRLETCLEGQRFYNLRRWATSLDKLNCEVSKVIISRKADGSLSYKKETVEKRNFTSVYLPIPYTEVKRAPGLVQNEGWEHWR